MLSKKFKAAVGLFVLSAAMLAGCGAPSSSSSSPETAKAEQKYNVLPEQCTVVDLDAKNYQPEPYAIAYNFRMGAVVFSTGTRGYISRDSAVMPMKDLAEDGQARAQEMYSKLPASANCKAPKFQ